MQSSRVSSLFEDLASGVGVLLAVGSDRLLPRPLGLDKLTVLGLGGVELGELVALIIGSDVEDGKVVIATDDKGTLDDGVVVDAIDGGGAEQVLAGTLQTVVEASNEVVGHEGHGELIIVLVLDLPDRVLVELDVLPEPLQRHGGLAVGILALPLIKREGGPREKLKRVLGLGLGRSGIVLLLGLGLRASFLGASFLGCLGLLGGNVGQLRGVEQSELSRRQRSRWAGCRQSRTTE